ncbi:MAG TPA: hypothetical protein HPP87_00730 [Planctomycetes bacterium]|nr:hypothetical protein [Planctomycetota bacterium]
MPIKERAIFFGEDTIDVSKWKLKKLEDVTFGLLSDRPGLFAFINSDDVQGDRFTVEIGHEPGEAMFTYEATIVDEDTMPYLKHRPKSR